MNVIAIKEKEKEEKEKKTKSKSRLSPHDRTFRALMKNPNIVHEFFHTHLPSEILDVVDLSTMKQQNDFLINDKLRQGIVDLLYEVDINGKPGYFYLLVEHASTPNRLLPFRIRQYVDSIIEHHLIKTGGTEPPIVYPLVYYTGKNPYTHSMDFFDLFGDDKEFARKIFQNPVRLIDLTQSPEDELCKYDWIGPMCLLQKHIHDPDMLAFLIEFVQVMKKLEQRGEIWYVNTIISYIGEAGEVSDPIAFRDEIKKEFEDYNGGGAMGCAEKMIEAFGGPNYHKKLAEKYEKQGEARGEARGAHRVACDFALCLLEQKQTVEYVAAKTGLSILEVQKLKKNMPKVVQIMKP